MVSDTLYDLCLPILQDDTIAEEDKPDGLQDLLQKQQQLTGKALEDAVLGILWQHKGAGSATKTLAPIRTVIARRPSPAPWQTQHRSITPTALSPRVSQASPHNLTIGPSSPGFKRSLSFTTAIPSPKSSPRTAYISPHIPHSPSLAAFQPNECNPLPELYDDLDSDNVDWLVNDDAAGSVSNTEVPAPIAAGDAYIAPYTIEMSPYDMLRSVLRDQRTDDELERVLEANGYDLSQTITTLLDAESLEGSSHMIQPEKRLYTVGKSMSPTVRSITPVGQLKTPVVCRYWLASGHCARADCRFSHDLENHICKYWLAGRCLAGDSCIFSHDPSALVSRIAIDDTSPNDGHVADFALSDTDSFPSLVHSTSYSYDSSDSLTATHVPSMSANSTSTLNPAANFVPMRKDPSLSRASSFQSLQAGPDPSTSQDEDAFPTLGSSIGKPSRKQATKSGRVAKEDTVPASLADIVRKAPTPQVISSAGSSASRPKQKSREESSAAMRIPPPDQIPWLETGDNANKAYLKSRAEAFRHGGLRNKFLQSAAQAWNRNDARAAKALSLRGQNENALMKEAHREAAKQLFDQRNAATGGAKEVFVDLHGS